MPICRKAIESINDFVELLKAFVMCNTHKISQLVGFNACFKLLVDQCKYIYSQ